MEVRRLDLGEWERVLPSSGFGVFHTPEALAVIDDHTEMEMQLYGGFKGEEPVGLLPVFLRENPLSRAAFSPPPSMSIPHMGPVLMPTSPKRRKIERTNRRFTGLLVDELDLTARLTLFRIVGSPGYADPRPFRWVDQEIDPRFTYVLDVTEELDTLMEAFSRDLRREIRRSREVDLDVSVEGADAAAQVARDVRRRYREQDEQAPITTQFVRDLVDALGHRARTYVARDPSGEYRGGIVTLFSNDRANFWQGGVSHSYEGVSVNSLLHWRIIEDIAAGTPIESVDGYDLVGANTKRLCDYKSKFDAELVPYYVAESPGHGMDVAKKAYRVINK